MMKLIAFALAATTAIAVQADQAAADGVIKYGVVSTFSGSAAPWGAAQSASVSIAIDDINNSGGIKVGDETYMLQRIEYDHAYDPTKAVTVARQAVQQDGVKFLEVLGAGVIPAVQTVTEPANALLFGQGGGFAWIGKDKPNSFQPFYNIGESAVAIMEHISKNEPDAKRVALIYPDDDLGEATAEVAIAGGKELGLDVERFFVGRDTTDFYPLFASLMQNPPDYIDFGGMPGPQYSVIVRQGVESGYKGKFMFSSTLDTGSFVKLGAESLIVGGLVSPAWISWNTDSGATWIERMDKAVPGNRQMWTGRSYDNLMLLKAAIEEAGTIDTVAVRDALERVSASGVAGEVRYRDHKMLAPFPVAKIELDGDGKIALKQVYEKTF